MVVGNGGRPIVVIDAPSNLGLRPPAPGRVPGVWRTPGVLRGLGLVARLGAVDGGCVDAPPYEPGWRPRFGVRNAAGIRRFSIALAERVGAAIDAGRFPLVLGGDCSVLLGPMLALRRRGRFGLVFVDGHLDFRHPGNDDQVNAAAGEDLALATGRGTTRLTGIDGLRPYVRDGDVVALGEREGDPETADILGTEIGVWNLGEVRRAGVDQTAGETIDRMEGGGVDGFWLHLDVDVLDDAVMPAVDSRQPDGLSWAELAGLIGPVLRSPLAIGMEVTIFDPELDPDGRVGARLAAALVGLLGGDGEGLVGA